MALRRVELDVISGTELPTLVIPWYDANGDPVDLSGVSTWILRLEAITDQGVTLDEITTGITGQDGTVTIGREARLAVGALNTSTSDVLLVYGELTADPAGDPRKALLTFHVYPAAQDIP